MVPLLGPGLIAVWLGIAHRYPVVVDDCGVHAGGPRHFDIDWADINEVVRVMPQWDRQLIGRVDPSSVAKYSRKQWPWKRLRLRLPRALGGASFQLPHFGFLR